MEFLLDRMQKCILMHFVCDTVRAMDTCAAQEPTWHPDKRDCPLGPPFRCTFAMSCIEFIFHEAIMSYKGSETRLCFSIFPAVSGSDQKFTW